MRSINWLRSTKSSYVMTFAINSAAIEKVLRETEDKKQFQRILCIWLKLLFSLNSAQIALVIGWKPSSVRNVQARFKKEGIKCFFGSRKGGRKRENMSLERETQILDKFARRAKRGSALDTKQIQKAYELSVGRPVPRSTIYRLIERHGLRRFLSKARTF